MQNGWSLNEKKPCSNHCVFFFANYSMWICLRALSLCGVWPLHIENPQVLQRGREDGRRRWQEIHRHKYPFGCRLYRWQTSHTGEKNIQFKLKGSDTERLTHSVKPSYIKRWLCGPYNKWCVSASHFGTFRSCCKHKHNLHIREKQAATFSSQLSPLVRQSVSNLLASHNVDICFLQTIVLHIHCKSISPSLWIWGIKKE